MPLESASSEVGGAMRRRAPERRTIILTAILAAGLWGVVELDLSPVDLLPGDGGLAVAKEIFARALSPALSYESEVPPAGAQPLLWKALVAAHQTVVFAVAAMTLAIAVGFPLGIVSSSTWWQTGSGAPASPLRSWIRLVLHGACRVLIAFMRSIHELLWAVLFLAAFGLSHLSAVVAIAIPFAGTLAKIFSEIIDEAPDRAADAIRSTGAGRLQVFLFALLPGALPDMGAYAFYRFECALRSSAILGFFGFPTLGYYISISFENLHYGELWTYLYTLLALVMAADWWSGSLRRRLMET